MGALKIIRESEQYKAGLWKPVAFEAREAVGGVWYVFIQILGTGIAMLNLSLFDLGSPRQLLRILP